MNDERIKQLDGAWTVYEQWLDYCKDCCCKRIRAITFAEWLHIEYRKARTGNGR